MSSLYLLPAGHILTVTARTGSVHAVQVQDPTVKAIITAPSSSSFGPYTLDRDFTVNGFGVGVITEASDIGQAADAVVDELATLHISGAGAPVDYTDGSPPASGEGTSPKGGLYSDTTNGFVYRNSGTQAQPIWTKLGDAA